MENSATPLLTHFSHVFKDREKRQLHIKCVECMVLSVWCQCLVYLQTLGFGVKNHLCMTFLVRYFSVMMIIDILWYMYSFFVTVLINLKSLEELKPFCTTIICCTVELLKSKLIILLFQWLLLNITWKNIHSCMAVKSTAVKMWFVWRNHWCTCSRKKMDETHRLCRALPYLNCPQTHIYIGFERLSCILFMTATHIQATKLWLRICLGALFVYYYGAIVSRVMLKLVSLLFLLPHV